MLIIIQLENWILYFMLNTFFLLDGRWTKKSGGWEKVPINPQRYLSAALTGALGMGSLSNQVESI